MVERKNNIPNQNFEAITDLPPDVRPGRRITENDVTEGLRVTNGIRTGTLTADPETQDIFQEGDELGWDEATMGPIGVHVQWDNSYAGYIAINVLRIAA